MFRAVKVRMVLSKTKCYLPLLPQLEPQSDAPRLVLAELFLVVLVSQFLQLDLFMFQIPPDFGMWKQSVGYAVLSREKVEK